MPVIRRLSGISPRELWDEHVLRREPVIITDLLDDFPDRDLASVIARFANEPNLELAPKPDGSDMTLGEWYAEAVAGKAVSKGTQTSYSAPTHDLPIEYARQATRFYAFVDALKTDTDRTWDRLGLQPATKDTALGFFGYQQATTCHFDGWVTQNLTAHVAGAKEWFLVAPQRIAALGPYGAAVLADPMKQALANRDALAEAVGGYSFTVQPGETLYWPHQWLHGTWYVEPSFSFVAHFGRDLASTFFTREVYRSFYRHAILEKMYPESVVFGTYAAEFRMLHDVCKVEYATPRERFVAVESALRTLYDQLYPERPLSSLPFNFAKVRNLEESEGERFYAEPIYEGSRKGWQRHLQIPLFDWWGTLSPG